MSATLRAGAPSVEGEIAQAWRDMPQITIEESDRQIQAINDRVQQAEKVKDWTAAIAALHELLDHPCAHHQLVVYEVWDTIYELHKRARDYDAAIAAKQEAIRSGYRSQPHPEADIAECHLLAGRRADADALFADLRKLTPDDVWLYNSAGFAYADVSDHVESARWFREGIEVALRTGDPDQVVVQLLDGLEAALEALGQGPDSALKERVEAFVEAWQPRALGDVGQYWGGDPPPLADQPCEHCGYDPSILRSSLARQGPNLRYVTRSGSAGPSLGRPRPSMVVSLAWFPRGEWEEAVDAWPDLLVDLPADHLAYSHRIEARLKRLARSLVGHPLRVAAMTVEGLRQYCTDNGVHPDSGEARASYAAELARLQEALVWPPGRNAPCWCGSGRKYKLCCGPVPMAPE